MKSLIGCCAALALLWVTGCTTSHGEEAGAVRSAISDCYEVGDAPGIGTCLEELEEVSSRADEVFDACFEEHFECASHHPEPELCDELAEICFDIYDDEPGEIEDVIGFCYDEAEECTRYLGVETFECLEVLGWCLGTFDDPAPIDKGDEIAELCFDGHLECLEWGEPELCDVVLDECLHSACDDEGPIDDPGDPCVEALQLCYETATPEEVELCDHLIDECWVDPHEPAWCDPEHPHEECPPGESPEDPPGAF